MLSHVSYLFGFFDVISWAWTYAHARIQNAHGVIATGLTIYFCLISTVVDLFQIFFLPGREEYVSKAEYDELKAKYERLQYHLLRVCESTDVVAQNDPIDVKQSGLVQRRLGVEELESVSFCQH
jgi:hypothetical protein